MEFLKSHPLAAVAVGVVLGVVFSQQISKVPGVNKLPRV